MNKNYRLLARPRLFLRGHIYSLLQTFKCMLSSVSIYFENEAMWGILWSILIKQQGHDWQSRLEEKTTLDRYWAVVISPWSTAWGVTPKWSRRCLIDFEFKAKFINCKYMSWIIHAQKPSSDVVIESKILWNLVIPFYVNMACAN